MGAKSDELFAEVTTRYLQKFGLKSEEIIFLYNSRELNPYHGKTLAEYKINNNATIDVILASNNYFGYNSNNNQLKNISSLNIFFKLNGESINIFAHSDDLFAKVAVKYAKKVGLNLDNVQFFFNSKELMPESGKTIEEYGIKNMSSIAVTLVNLINLSGNSSNVEELEKLEKENRELKKQLNDERDKNNLLIRVNNDLKKQIKLLTVENKKMQEKQKESNKKKNNDFFKF